MTLLAANPPGPGHPADVDRRASPAGRRRTGVALLVGAVLAVVVVGRLHHPDTVAGAASPDRAVLPPVTGQCLLIPPVGVDPWAYTTAAAPLPLGRCDQPHYGEVIAVLDVNDVDLSIPVCLQPEVVDPTAYLGFAGKPDVDAGWYPVLDYLVVPSGPNARQITAGQRWIACSLAAPTTGNDVSFTDPLQNAFNVGRVPASMALCYDGADPSVALSVPCDQPHRSQFFAHLALSEPGPDQAAVTAGCVDAVALLSRDEALPRSADVAVRTVVRVFEGTTGATVEASLPLDVGESAYVTCTVESTGDRLLGGSLLGLAGDPIPWAP